MSPGKPRVKPALGRAGARVRNLFASNNVRQAIKVHISRHHDWRHVATYNFLSGVFRHFVSKDYVIDSLFGKALCPNPYLIPRLLN